MAAANVTTSSLNTTPWPSTTDPFLPSFELYDAALGVYTILVSSCILAISLLVTVIVRERRHELVFYLNVVMLALTIADALVMLPFVWLLISSAVIVNMLHFIHMSLIAAIKIVAESVLILRLYALHPSNYLLLLGCASLVLLRSSFDIYGIVVWFQHGINANAQSWELLVEPFLEAANNLAFSSVFILTLGGQMYRVRSMIGGLRRHRLFGFLVLAIENMVVPCMTSLTLAIFSLYITTFVENIHRFTLVAANISTTVTSIVLTSILGHTSMLHRNAIMQQKTFPARVEVDVQKKGIGLNDMYPFKALSIVIAAGQEPMEPKELNEEEI